MRKTSEISERKNRSPMWLAGHEVMCLESNWKYNLRAYSLLPVSPSGESTARKLKTMIDKCLYMAIFNTKTMGMKAEYLAQGGGSEDRMGFNGFIQGAVRWRLNKVNMSHSHAVQTDIQEVQLSKHNFYVLFTVQLVFIKTHPESSIVKTANVNVGS